MLTTTRSQCECPSRRGTSIVELLLVLPIVFAVVCGVVEFGRAIIVGQLVTNAAKLGAQRASVEGVDTATVDAAVREYLQETAGVSPQRVCVLVDDMREQFIPGCRRQGIRPRTAKTCAVTVAVNYDDVAYLAGQFLTGTQLTGTCSLSFD